MNSGSIGGIHPVSTAAITSDLAGLLQDTDLGATLTVRTPGVSAFDPLTGTVAASGNTSDSITGWWSPLTARETGPETVYEIGDRRFTALASDFSVPPTTAAVLIDDTTRYAVIAVETAQLGGVTQFYHLIARKTG